jgi:hypothetical protein
MLHELFGIYILIALVDTDSGVKYFKDSIALLKTSETVMHARIMCLSSQ